MSSFLLFLFVFHCTGARNIVIVPRFEYAMADNNHQEANNLRLLVVKLAKELDYKNHLLMEKEGLSLEKFAAMSSLIEEKDRLLGERSNVIGSLMAQKHRLHEVFVKEMRKCDQMKQEMKNFRRDLEIQQHKSDTRTTDQDNLLTSKGKGLWTVTTNATNANGCLRSSEIKLSVPADQLNETSDKHDNLQNCLKKLQHLRSQNEDLNSELEILRKDLNEKGEALHQLKSLNRTLKSNESSSNEELKAARMEAIKCFLTMDGNGTKVRIKRIGEINPQPFRDVCSQKYHRSWEEKFNKLYSVWQGNVNDPGWNPFKKDINSGEMSEEVDENDKKLAELREEWGEEAYKSVVDALLEFRKYSPNMKCSIRELWNFEEGRRAQLKEVIQYIIQRWEAHRNKDNEQSGAIVELMAEKDRLLRKLAGINVLMGEKDKLLKAKYAAIGKSEEQDLDKYKLPDKMSATISTLTAEKRILLESRNAEKRTTQCMKEHIEKLKHVLQSQNELAKQAEEHTEIKHHSYGDDKSIIIKEENMEWYLDCLRPIAKKLKGSKDHDSERQISSTSKNIKLPGQNTEEISKLPKTERGMFGDLSDERLDVLGTLRQSTQSYLIPSKTVVPSPSHSAALER